jgi:hypothetical protein
MVRGKDDVRSISVGLVFRPQGGTQRGRGHRPLRLIRHLDPRRGVVTGLLPAANRAVDSRGVEPASQLPA